MLLRHSTIVGIVFCLLLTVTAFETPAIADDGEVVMIVQAPVEDSVGSISKLIEFSHHYFPLITGGECVSRYKVLSAQRQLGIYPGVTTSPRKYARLARSVDASRVVLLRITGFENELHLNPARGLIALALKPVTNGVLGFLSMATPVGLIISLQQTVSIDIQAKVITAQGQVVYSNHTKTVNRPIFAFFNSSDQHAVHNAFRNIFNQIAPLF